MGRIVISMDSHTELVPDLKPYLPKKWHAEFAAGEAKAKQYVSIMTQACKYLLKDLLRGEDGEPQDQSVAQSGPGPVLAANGRPVDVQEYIRPLPMKERLAMIDADGVAAEFITPFIGAYSDSPDFLHDCNAAYNRYFADYVSPAPFRFTGSTIANLICGIDTVLKEIDDAYEHGLRALSLPGNVSHAARDLPTYNCRFYDPMWAALAERKMAAIFHAGFSREKPLLRFDGSLWPWSVTGRPEPGWELLVQDAVVLGDFDYLKYLLAGSVAERFPDLRIGILESGVHWIAPVIQRIDDFWNSQRNLGYLTSYRGELSPMEQWHRQFFVSTTFTKDEIALRNTLGVHNMMWGSDFPHVESTYPRSRKFLANLLAGMPDEEADAIAFRNAAEMMGFDLEKLAQTQAAQVPWPD
jgi:predicted TIM-barrel fold metal-dependent hydrolase